MPDILFDSWGIEPRGTLVGELSGIPEKHSQFAENEKLAGGIGAVMGWGGLVVLDEGVCVVHMVHDYFQLIQEKSCGKCVPCRVGSKVILDILTRIVRGEGQETDLDTLQELVTDIKNNGKCGYGIAMYNPLSDALTHFRQEFIAHISGENRCEPGTYQKRMIAPCNFGCPITTDAARYIELIAEGKFLESCEVAREPNPVPGILGRACFHPCEDVCKRGDLDEPIAICALKRFVADYEQRLVEEGQLAREFQAPKAVKGKVAVVGAGPAGIACAKDLALMGYQVTIFEKYPVVGGTMYLGIPEYRLPRDLIEREVAELEALGVEIKTDTPIGEDLTIDDLMQQQGYGAIFLGIGAMKGRKLGIPGEDDFEGLFDCIEYLRRINLGDTTKLGEKVLIVGGGNSAIDGSRVSVRLGCEEVYIVYRRTRKEMPASEWEIEEAEHEGVKLNYLAAPVRILGEAGKVTGMECVKMELGEPDESGRRRPVPIEGSEFVIDADLIVPAISQSTDFEFLGEDHGFEITRWNTFVVDEDTCATNRPGIFAGGDAGFGPDSVVSALQHGHMGAAAIDKYLSSGTHEDFDQLNFFRKVMDALGIKFDDEQMPNVAGAERQSPHALPPEERIKDFREVELVLSKERAIEEARRCMRCFRIMSIAERTK